MRRGPWSALLQQFLHLFYQIKVLLFSGSVYKWMLHFYNISSVRISHIIFLLFSVFSMQKWAEQPADDSVDPGPCLFFLLKSGLIAPGSVKSLLQAAGYGRLSCSGQIAQRVCSGDYTVFCFLFLKMVEIVLISAVFHFKKKKWIRSWQSSQCAASVRSALEEMEYSLCRNCGDGEATVGAEQGRGQFSCSQNHQLAAKRP